MKFFFQGNFSTKIIQNQFEKLIKLPIINQRDSVRLDKDKQNKASIYRKTRLRREIDVAEQLIKQENPSKYIVKYYRLSNNIIILWKNLMDPQKTNLDAIFVVCLQRQGFGLASQVYQNNCKLDVPQNFFLQNLRPSQQNASAGLNQMYWLGRIKQYQLKEEMISMRVILNIFCKRNLIAHSRKIFPSFQLINQMAINIK